jgi:hypothetical protein
VYFAFIWCQRNEIPQQVLERYFGQKQWSLKCFISHKCCNIEGEGSSAAKIHKLHLIYTKTDPTILSIPDWPPKDGNESTQQEWSGVQVAHEDPDRLIIAHLRHLKSESSVQRVVDNWQSSEKRDVLIMVVDVGEVGATEKINFVRSCIENAVRGQDRPDKCFVAVCHYRASSSNFRSVYPALFLGSWSHTYMDHVMGVGTNFVDVNACMASALDGSAATEEDAANSHIEYVLKNMMPASLIKMAGLPLFCTNATADSGKHDINGGISLQCRHERLYRLMFLDFGGDNLASILCHKLAALWTRKSLSEVLDKMSRSLVEGMSQLSLSASLHVTLQDSLDAFLSVTLRDMNHGRNLDLLCNMADEDYGLRGLALLFIRGVSGPPLKELILHRSHANASPRAMSSHTGAGCVAFPFSTLVSSYFEQLVDEAEEGHAKERHSCLLDTFNEFVLIKSVNGTELSSALDVSDVSEIHEMRLTTAMGRADRSMILQKCMEFISARSEEERRLFIRKYVEDFVVSKYHVVDQKVVGWFLSKLIPMLQDPNLLIHVHWWARRYEKDIWNILSCQANDTIIGGQLSVTESRMNILKNFVRQNVMHLENESCTVPGFLESLKQVMTLARQDLCSDGQSTRALRVLCFLHVLCSTDRAPTSVKAREIEHWAGHVLSKDVPEEPTLGNLLCRLGGRCDQSDVWRPDVQNRLFRVLFSDWWVELMYDDRDVMDLIDFVQHDKSFDKRQSLFISCFRSISRASPLGAERCVQVVPGLHLSRHALSSMCENRAEAMGDGRVCADEARVGSRLRFIPSWLFNEERDRTLQLPAASNAFSFANFERAFKVVQSNVADAFFSVVLGHLMMDFSTTTARQALLAALDAVQTEISVSENECMRQSRLVSLKDLFHTKGTCIGVLVAEARVLVFVLRIAVDLANGAGSEVFNFLEGEEAERFFSQALSSGGCLYSKLFLRATQKLKGTSFVLQLLQGPLQFLSWKDEWLNGNPAFQDSHSN